MSAKDLEIWRTSRQRFSEKIQEKIRKRNLINPMKETTKPPQLNSADDVGATPWKFERTCTQQRVNLPEYSIRPKSTLKNLKYITSSVEYGDLEDRMANVYNDYAQHFIDTGKRPQNFVRDADLSQRFDEYPKLKELAKLKNQLVAERATPPMYLQADLRTYDLRLLDTKFDVILIDPPLEEYCRRSPMIAGTNRDFWTYEELASLRIEEIAANPSFIFIWSGSSEGLDLGRRLLSKWGYRRCEDIVWSKTNRTWEGSRFIEGKSVFQHTKEHCLMGIKGTVRRSTDGHFIHCNVDTDIIISEEPSHGSTAKPEEIYHIIEHFCLGRRRLELFGENHNIRPGWVTVGQRITGSNYNSAKYNSYFAGVNGHLLGGNPEIEALRPRSPPPRDGSSKLTPKKKPNHHNNPIGNPKFNLTPITNPGLYKNNLGNMNRTFGGPNPNPNPRW